MLVEFRTTDGALLATRSCEAPPHAGEYVSLTQGQALTSRWRVVRVEWQVTTHPDRQYYSLTDSLMRVHVTLEEIHG